MNIPNLPIGAIVDKDGLFTDVGKNFFNQLIVELQTNASQEGLVSPTQTASNIVTIQNSQLPNGEYATSYGTILYDSTNNTGRFAINNGSGAPIFKTFVLV